MSPADTPANAPQTPPADAPPPPAPAAPPPPTPDPPTPPKAADGDDGDRVGKLESMMGNVMEAIGSLTDAIANGTERETQPQKKPWTHWGTKS